MILPSSKYLHILLLWTVKIVRSQWVKDFYCSNDRGDSDNQALLFTFLITPAKHKIYQWKATRRDRRDGTIKRTLDDFFSTKCSFCFCTCLPIFLSRSGHCSFRFRCLHCVRTKRKKVHGQTERNILKIRNKKELDRIHYLLKRNKQKCQNRKLIGKMKI
jgi:hypothetical protein